MRSSRFPRLGLLLLVTGCGSGGSTDLSNSETDASTHDVTYVDARLESDAAIRSEAALDASRSDASVEGGLEAAQCGLDPAIKVGAEGPGRASDQLVHDGDLYLLTDAKASVASLSRISQQGAVLNSVLLDSSPHFSLSSSPTGVVVVSQESGALVMRTFDANPFELASQTIADADAFDPYLRPKAVHQGADTYIVYARDRSGESYFEELWRTGFVGGTPLAPTRLSARASDVDNYDLLEVPDGRVVATWESDSKVAFAELDGSAVRHFASDVSLSASKLSFDAHVVQDRILLAGSWAASGPGVTGNDLHLASVSLGTGEILKKALPPRHHPVLATLHATWSESVGTFG